MFSQTGEKKRRGRERLEEGEGEKGIKRIWQLHRDITKLILGQFKHWFIEESKSPSAFWNSLLFMDEWPWGVKYFHDSEAQFNAQISFNSRKQKYIQCIQQKKTYNKDYNLKIQKRVKLEISCRIE